MRVRRRVPWRALLPVVALVLVLLTALVPAPYVIESPGPVTNTLGTTQIDGTATPVIRIPGKRTYPTAGALDLLTVSVVGSPSATPSWLTLAANWFDPAQSVTPIGRLYPPGLTQKQSAEEGAAEMTGSQQSAVAAALTHLGYRVTGTVTVRSVGASTAAAGVVRTGDVVRSFAGHPVADSCTLQDLVLAHGTAPTPITLQRSGSTRTATVAPRGSPTSAAGSKRPPARHHDDVDLPLPVRGDAAAGGCGRAVGRDDVRARHHRRADARGADGRCARGGDRHDLRGRRRSGRSAGSSRRWRVPGGPGATVFLAPASNCDEVVGHIPDGLHVFSVRNLSEALAVLKSVAARGSTAGLATCSAQVGSGR